ncbi:uncharacterized protein LOC135213544 [Macrobrachium nipponense]|uniref:uncharacterized protein LOC135213544 n=1 Tax=Macrobrachium nipponense TaxID=159736 RepID=UPI0030C7FCB1
MTVLVLMIVLLNLGGGALGQMTQTSSFSLGSLFQLPRHCIVNLLSCKESCSECGYCYEKFLDCVMDFTADKKNQTLGGTPGIQNTEGTFEDDTTENEMPSICIEKFKKCLQGNCTECILCFNVAIECVDQHTMQEADDDDDDDDYDNYNYFAGPMHDAPRYPGWFGYPASPLQYGDFMAYSNHPGYGVPTVPMFPGGADQRSGSSYIDQLTNAFNLGQLPFIPNTFGFFKPQVQSSTPPTVPVNPTTENMAVTVNPTTETPTTENVVTPTTDPPVLFQGCLSRFTKCLVTCFECNTCFPEFQKCSVSAFRPRIKFNV